MSYSRIKLMCWVKQLALLVFLVPAMAVSAQAGTTPIGYIKTLNQNAAIVTDGKKRDVSIGDPVFEGDAIRTSRNGTLGVVFVDGAVMSIGSGSKVTLEQFLFEPDTKNVGFTAVVAAGNMSFISGAIGRISPDSVRITTPTATLGLRGTKILVDVK
ncbi:MAG: FecR domain-containing protein [Moraxellaceae bacterium]|nr:FecR domain-containing protein [Moraxellaceae bacterium]